MIGEIFQDSRFLDNVGKRYVENISLGIWRWNKKIFMRDL